MINGFKATAINLVLLLSSKRGRSWMDNSNSLSTKIFDIIKKMKIGDISQPIIKQNTIVIFKIDK